MKLYSLLAILFFAGTAVQAQQLNTEFKVTKIVPTLQASPNYSGAGYDKRGAKPGSWLEVEVAFDWLPKLRDPLYLDDVTVNYYILLNAVSKDAPKGVLLSGSVAHVNVAQGKDARSVMFVSPQAIAKFFAGKVPTNAAQAVQDVGITISKGGELVAEGSWKGKGQWWTLPIYKAAPGFLLNKTQTPFAPLSWDYFQEVKPANP